jgi:hypothetical protein
LCSDGYSEVWVGESEESDDAEDMMIHGTGVGVGHGVWKMEMTGGKEARRLGG